MRITRRTTPAAVLAALLVLSGCSFAPEPRVTRVPTDAASPTASASVTSAPQATEVAPAPPGPRDCSGRTVVITSASLPDALAGECAEVDIQGNDLVVDAAAASVAIMEMAGDRIVVSVGAVGALIIAGNDIQVTVGDVSALTIRGDRNEVTASGSITGVSLQGNDNTVRGAGSLVDDQGARNVVE